MIGDENYKVVRDMIFSLYELLKWNEGSGSFNEFAEKYKNKKWVLGTLVFCIYSDRGQRGLFFYI